MEWYWIVAIIVLFAGVFFGFWYLRKKGLLTAEQMGSLAGVISGLAAATTALAKTNENPAFNIADMVMMFVNKAVLAAENAWYNEDIKREDRYEYCLERLRELMEAYDIKLTDAQWNVVDTMISAACEEIGHTEEVVIEEVEG